MPRMHGLIHPWIQHEAIQAFSSNELLSPYNNQCVQALEFYRACPCCVLPNTNDTNTSVNGNRNNYCSLKTMLLNDGRTCILAVVRSKNFEFARKGSCIKLLKWKWSSAIIAGGRHFHCLASHRVVDRDNILCLEVLEMEVFGDISIVGIPEPLNMTRSLPMIQSHASLVAKLRDMYGEHDSTNRKVQDHLNAYNDDKLRKRQDVQKELENLTDFFSPPQEDTIMEKVGEEEEVKENGILSDISEKRNSIYFEDSDDESEEDSEGLGIDDMLETQVESQHRESQACSLRSPDTTNGVYRSESGGINTFAVANETQEPEILTTPHKNNSSQTCTVVSTPAIALETQAPKILFSPQKHTGETTKTPPSSMPNNRKPQENSNQASIDTSSPVLALETQAPEILISPQKHPSQSSENSGSNTSKCITTQCRETNNPVAEIESQLSETLVSPQRHYNQSSEKSVSTVSKNGTSSRLKILKAVTEKKRTNESQEEGPQVRFDSQEIIFYGDDEHTNCDDTPSTKTSVGSKMNGYDHLQQPSSLSSETYISQLSPVLVSNSQIQRHKEKQALNGVGINDSEKRVNHALIDSQKNVVFENGTMLDQSDREIIKNEASVSEKGKHNHTQSVKRSVDDGAIGERTHNPPKKKTKFVKSKQRNTTSLSMVDGCSVDQEENIHSNPKPKWKKSKPPNPNPIWKFLRKER